MKKVWILERFYTPEDLQNIIKEMEADYQQAVADKKEMKIINALDDAILITKREFDEHPDGEWCGFVGRTVYKQFCEDARDAIIRNLDKFQMRVIEGQIPDRATMWWGYKVVKENEGVMKYLMATARG